MQPRFDIALQRWLSAEREGRESDAEMSLARVFDAIPAASPSAHFADRVLESVGLARPVPVYPLWGRMAIGTCLLLAGFTLALVLPFVQGLFLLVPPGEIFATAVATFVSLVSRIDDVLALFQVLGKILQTSMLVATSPQVVFTLLVLSALATLIFRALSDLVSPRRSSAYVQAR